MEETEDNQNIIKKIASYIDHTLLKNDVSEEEIKKACSDAIKYDFKTICIMPKYIPLAVRLLKDHKTIPITVVDFPLGSSSPIQKALEAKNSIISGAKEIDMVIDYKAIIAKDYKTAFEGIKAVVAAASPFPVKVIIETSELSYEEKIISCALAKAANAKFVKTSTGFSKKGATKEDVALMKRIIGNDMYVKASGGIKSIEDALIMIKAGASRIGTSSSIKIIEEAYKINSKKNN
ncbi:MAG: deoxyribose-phosphate aldolase [Parachlamydiales bacterium]|jgi:deoxyribose-phosphate aldolase